MTRSTPTYSSHFSLLYPNVPRVISLTSELRTDSKLHPSFYTVFCLASAPLPCFDNLTHLQWARLYPILILRRLPDLLNPNYRACGCAGWLWCSRPTRCLANYESSQSDRHFWGDEFVGISTQKFLSFSSTTAAISESHSASHLKHDLLSGVPTNFLSHPQKAVTAHRFDVFAF